MHPVNISGPAPTMQLPIKGDRQPCLQSAAFRRGHAVVLAVLNICNSITTISVSLPPPTTADHVATMYDLTDPGGKAPLPVNPTVFPWPAPLHAITSKVSVTSSGCVYTAAPLTFAMVEPSTWAGLKSDDATTSTQWKRRQGKTVSVSCNADTRLKSDDDLSLDYSVPAWTAPSFNDKGSVNQTMAFNMQVAKN
eukprot:SAG11_NODE_11771_length_739_cov_0.864062_1_plen_193_part_01